MASKLAIGREPVMGWVPSREELGGSEARFLEPGISRRLSARPDFPLRALPPMLRRRPDRGLRELRALKSWGRVLDRRARGLDGREWGGFRPVQSGPLPASDCVERTMQCPFCKVDDDRVIDSRSIGEGNAIRRRRSCAACGKRFTTYERIEVAPRVVVKKDSSRETFTRDKILSGMIKACQKRNISLEELEGVASKIEAEIFEEHDSEVPTMVIGERVSNALKKLDHVAFVRFASVYREFKDVKEFLAELMPLVRTHLSQEDLDSKLSTPKAIPGAGGDPS